MAMYLKAGKESLNPLKIIDYVKFKIAFRRDHPDYFDPDGILVFVGPQGSGKTLSAVNYVYRLLDLYPNSKLVTNLMLDYYPVVEYEEFLKTHNDFIESLFLDTNDKDLVYAFMRDRYIKDNRVFSFLNNDDFGKYDNSEYGIIYLVDEIQLYLSSLESKNINMETVTELSQQRKERSHIVCTSQVFGRMAKPLREQFSNVVLCKNYFGFLQKNMLIDRDSLTSDSSTGTNITGTVKKQFFWIHQPTFFSRYDTYYKIKKGKFVGGEQQLGGIYEHNIRLSGDN